MKKTLIGLLLICGASLSGVSHAQEERLQVTLVNPHPTNFGVIIIEGSKAKDLYDALEVLIVEEPEPVPGSIYGPSKVKTGTNYSCSEYALDLNPADLLYSCSLHLDYKSGEVKRR